MSPAIRDISGRPAGGGAAPDPTYEPILVMADAHFSLEELSGSTEILRTMESYAVETNQAVQFDGIATRITGTFADLPFGNISTEDFSVAFYARFDSLLVKTDQVCPIQGRRNSSNMFRVAVVAADTVRFAVRDSYAWRSVDVTVAVDTWYHFVFTWDAATDTVVLYVNGVSTGVQASNAVRDAGTDSVFQIGAQTDNHADSFYEGRLDQLVVWDSVLTSDEVAAIYAGGTSFDPQEDSGDYASSSNLSLWWDFQTISPDGTPILSDGSSYGNPSPASGP